MKNVVAIAALACWTLACSPDGGHMSIGGSGDGPGKMSIDGDGKGSPPDANGQTGSPGELADECKQAKDCVPRAEGELAALQKPAMSARTFSGAQCVQLGVIAGAQSANGPACECATSGGGSLAIGPVGLGCFAYGRGGDCLWDDSEFEGCEIGAAGACQDVCDEFEQRIADDAARTFDTRVVYTACDEQTVCHDVVEIDGRCYADRSYQNGRDYDCTLGGEEILARKAQDDNPEMTEIPPRSSPYVDGTSGFINLGVGTEFIAGVQISSGFGADAQFFTTTGGKSVDYGMVLDPLEGIDDCGVAQSSGFGESSLDHFISIGDLVLTDRGEDHRFMLSSASNKDFYQYILDLGEAGVEPRYGESYSVSGGGGTFGEKITIEDLRLPEALSITSLDRTARVERDALRFSWTGSSKNPLRIYLMVQPQLTDSSFMAYEINCLAADDGEFEIPAAVLAAVPEGILSVQFTRERRALVPAGSKTVLTIAGVGASHRLALGKRCDNQDVMDACLRSAEVVRAAFAKCSPVEAPSVDELCPAYLAESCIGCTEYFDCQTEHTTCTDVGLTVDSVCSCPAPATD